MAALDEGNEVSRNAAAAEVEVDRANARSRRAALVSGAPGQGEADDAHGNLVAFRLADKLRALVLRHDEDEDAARRSRAARRVARRSAGGLASARHDRQTSRSHNDWTAARVRPLAAIGRAARP